jgi:hypothetical protein
MATGQLAFPGLTSVESRIGDLATNEGMCPEVTCQFLSRWAFVAHEGSAASVRSRLCHHYYHILHTAVRGLILPAEAWYSHLIAAASMPMSTKSEVTQ